MKNKQEIKALYTVSDKQLNESFEYEYSILPCINCITLAICKSTVREYYYQYPGSFILRELCDKCSLMLEYIYIGKERPFMNHLRIAIALRYLKPLSSINEIIA
jgi:hypothetical protein